MVRDRIGLDPIRDLEVDSSGAAVAADRSRDHPTTQLEPNVLDKSRVGCGLGGELGWGEKVDPGLLHPLGDQETDAADDEGGTDEELATCLHAELRGDLITSRIYYRLREDGRTGGRA